MLVGVVIPAWRRPAVTSLCLHGLEWLAGRLALSGITLRSLVIANDDNLDVANSHGVPSVEADNVLGDRVNRGFRYWAREGADWLMFSGSDNWVHPHVFAHLEDDRRARTGGYLTIVDLERPRLRCLKVTTRAGAAPWVIPTEALRGCGYRPVPKGKTVGMEFWIGRAVECGWRFDMLRHGRVDFKTGVNITPYRALAADLDEETDPWVELAKSYPADLVASAWETSRNLEPLAA